MEPDFPKSNFINATEDMAARIRSFEWDKTILGAVNQWPPLLLSMVNLVLASDLAMILQWGEEKIQFYNDQFQKILGDTDAFGQQKLDLELLPAGVSYNPIHNEDGKEEGILVICIESSKSGKQSWENDEQLKRVLDHMAEGVGITDRAGHILYSNPMAHQILGTDKDRFPERRNNSPEWHNVHLDGSPMKDSEHPTNIAMATGRPVFNYEFAIDRPGFERMYLVMNAAPFADPGGEVSGSVGIFTDITERKKTEEALRSSITSLAENEQMLQLTMESAGMSTWQAYLESGEMVLQERTRMLHGLPDGLDISLTESFEMIDPIHRSRVEKQIMEAIREKSSFITEYLIHPMNGGPERWIRASGSVQCDQEGKPVGIWGSVLDITGQKQNEQRKNDFISMVSHELKTPLTSTLSYVQVTKKKATDHGDKTAAEMLSRAEIQLGKMTTLINGFLNVSRLEAGKIYIEKRRIDMAVLIKEIEGGMLVEKRSHTLVFHPVEETWVNVDRDKIEQVVNNFISNAIKYSPPRSTIHISCVTQGEYAQISVKDEGIGIKRHEQEKLFDRFYRVEGKETRTVAGFGIGLFICKEIVERHDGRIGVDSEPGKGSEFWFTLPIDRS
jgi:PAS domain S-box-containing protein